jgi:hypothetical protein
MSNMVGRRSAFLLNLPRGRTGQWHSNKEQRGAWKLCGTFTIDGICIARIWHEQTDVPWVNFGMEYVAVIAGKGCLASVFHNS